MGKIKETIDNFNRKEEEWAGLLSTLQTKQDNLQTQLEELRTESPEATAEKQALQAKITELEAKITELQERPPVPLSPVPILPSGEEENPSHGTNTETPSTTDGINEPPAAPMTRAAKKGWL